MLTEAHEPMYIHYVSIHDSVLQGAKPLKKPKRKKGKI